MPTDLLMCFFFLSVAMALLVPDLDLFISLSGAICMSTLSLITPAMLDMIVRYPGEYVSANYQMNGQWDISIATHWDRNLIG